MLAVYDDKIEPIDIHASTRSDLMQLELDVSRFAEQQQGLDDPWLDEERRQNVANDTCMLYPTAPKAFKMFDSPKNLRHDGHMLTCYQISDLYIDRVDVRAASIQLL